MTAFKCQTGRKDAKSNCPKLVVLKIFFWSHYDYYYEQK